MGYIENFRSGHKYVLFLDSNGNPDKNCIVMVCTTSWLRLKVMTVYRIFYDAGFIILYVVEFTKTVVTLS